jgi:hypothetical protein
LTDFVCLYNYEFWLSLCKIVRSSVILLLPLFDSSSVFDHFIYQKNWHHVSITCRQQDDEKLSQFALMNCIYSSCSIFSILCIITTPCISIYLYKKIQNYKLTYRRFRIFININVTQMYQWYWWKRFSLTRLNTDGTSLGYSILSPADLDLVINHDLNKLSNCSVSHSEQ